jgi:hypothetical protein
MELDKNIIINKKLTFNSGINWLKKSFVIFREQPIQFIILEFFAILVIFLPFMGAFLQPFFGARFLLLANKVGQNKPILLKDIFREFFISSGLIRLSVINFLLNILLLLVNYIFKINNSSILNIVLFGVLPTIVTTMLIWFAPALVIFDKILPFRAMMLSFRGVSSNLFAMLIFSIVISAISIIIIVPFIILGYFISQHFHIIFVIPVVIIGVFIWLFWGAILNITTYFAYKDLFINYNR